MTTANLRESSQEYPAPEALLAALREAGPTGLAELIGDTDFLLSALATTPREMFTPGARPRDVYKNLLDTIHEARSSLDALEARAVVALAEATTRDQVHAARDEAVHENAVLAPPDRLIRQADAKTARDFSLATRRSPSITRSTLSSARRLVGAMPRMLHALARGKGHSSGRLRHRFRNGPAR